VIYFLEFDCADLRTQHRDRGGKRPENVSSPHSCRNFGLPGRGRVDLLLRFKAIGETAATVRGTFMSFCTSLPDEEAVATVQLKNKCTEKSCSHVFTGCCASIAAELGHVVVTFMTTTRRLAGLVRSKLYRIGSSSLNPHPSRTPPLRVEFLLKTDNGYPKDTGVNKPWQPLGIPSATTPIGQLHHLTRCYGIRQAAAPPSQFASW